MSILLNFSLYPEKKFCSSHGFHQVLFYILTLIAATELYIKQRTKIFDTSISIKGPIG